ncbi:MazG-like family protein [Natrononativus amylolyticus]|uniref:MazG-like family protein n=1 Tax=Natrononativus amylolyticus TaxID=2963434 RepID=UPI0020CC2C97|nr:MazG-like family protein [Natrononativus amylolyticus]
MDEQDRVAAFVDRHGIDEPPAYRALDLASEVGEVAKEVTESSDYGASPDDVEIAGDELGDALFALLALCESVDVDAGAALEAALAKYEARLEETGSPASGE